MLAFLGSIFMFIIGTIAVLVVMALVAWVTGILESMDGEQAVEAAAPQPAAPGVAPAAAPASASGAPAPAPVASAAAAPVSSGVEPNIVAVITAAVTAALAGRPFRIKTIQLATSASTTTWAQAGRQTIHASHAIERKFR